MEFDLPALWPRPWGPAPRGDKVMERVPAPRNPDERLWPGHRTAWGARAQSPARRCRTRDLAGGSACSSVRLRVPRAQDRYHTSAIGQCRAAASRVLDPVRPIAAASLLTWQISRTQHPSPRARCGARLGSGSARCRFHDPFAGPERDDRIEAHHYRRCLPEALHDGISETGQHYVALPVELGQPAHGPGYVPNQHISRQTLARLLGAANPSLP